MIQVDAALAFFLVVPPLAMVLFALSITAIILMPKESRSGFVVSGAVCGAAGLAGVFIAAWMWRAGFDFTDANKPVPQAVDRSMAIGLFVACGSYVGILATGTWAAVSRRRLSR